MEEMLHVVLVSHLDAGGHIEGDEDRQPRVRHQQMERQAKHAQHVVRIQPGALLRRLRTQGEEVLEDATVDDHPADQRHQHEHTGHADHVEADHPAMQLVVQFEEEVAADGPGQYLAALGVHQEGLELAEVRRLPASRPVRHAFGGRVHPVAVGLGRALDDQLTHLVGTDFHLFQLVQLRCHPAGELLVEHRDGAGEQHDKENPADQQPAPRVQAGHGLAQAHGRTP